VTVADRPLVRTFLQPPSSPAEWVADGVRGLGVLSAVAAGIGWGGVDVAVFALALAGIVVPRFLGVRPALDIAFGLALLVAAWSSVLELYLTVRWWDLPVHFVLNGLVAVIAYLAAARAGLVPDPDDTALRPAGPVLVTAALGVTGGVLWEVGEWAGHTFLDPTIFVGYSDTIGDLVVGGAGSVLAALPMRFWADRRRAS
jgi:hypothetical protein